MAKEVRDNTWESVYHIRQKRFLKLADKNIPDLALHPSGRIAFGSNPWPYARYVSFYGRFTDVYVVDTRDGKKTLVKKKLYGYRGGSISPGGRYIYWYLDKHWYLYDIRKKITTNLTENLKVRFDRDDWDTPNPPMSYGSAGWTRGDSSILLYDKYDIWEIKPDGTSARMITEGYGRKNRITFRYQELDPEEEFIVPDKAIFLSATNRDTMATGYYLDKIKGKALPEKLIMQDTSLRIMGKAKNGAKLVYTGQSFDIYPDLWISDLKFEHRAKLTNLGKQMAPFLWGKSELRNFSSADGRSLKGVLVTPEYFDRTKKYPLMIYIHETLRTYMTHRFRAPGPGSSINPTYYVSNGYVLLPTWLPKPISSRLQKRGRRFPI